MLSRKHARQERMETLDDLLSIGSQINNCTKSGNYTLALFALDQIDGNKRDALYAGVALGIAKGFTGKESKEYRELADKVIKYCADNSSYLR